MTYARPADFPGLGATITETVDVNVSIPTSHADAENIYRQGNVVRVLGQLDCRMEVQGGPSVRAKLAEIDAEWAERKAQLADKPVELRKAEGAYRRTRQRFETAARLFVLAGHVELLVGRAAAAGGDLCGAARVCAQSPAAAGGPPPAHRR